MFQAVAEAFQEAAWAAGSIDVANANAAASPGLVGIADVASPSLLVRESLELVVVSRLFRDDLKRASMRSRFLIA
jgi:hypothetical protein